MTTRRPIPIRFFLVTLVHLAILGCMFAALLYAQPDELTIENKSAYATRNRSGVYFPHDIHMESVGCLDCHHDYAKGENLLDEDDLVEDGSARCAACHTGKSSIGLREAYHKQCMTCHRSTNKLEAMRLPITCKDCHPVHALQQK